MEKGVKHFLIKSVVFFSIFCLILVFYYSFQPNIFWYRAVFNYFVRFLFVLVFFVLTLREKVHGFKEFPFQWKHALFFGLISTVLFAYRFTMPITEYRKFVTISAFLFFTLAVYGIPFLKYLVKNFWKELLLSVIVLAAINFILSYKILTLATSTVIYHLISLTHGSVSMSLVEEELFFQVGNFQVIVGEACSGIESLMLFVAVYFVFVIIEFDRINKKKALKWFAIGLAGAYLIVLLRMYLLLISGVYFGLAFVKTYSHELTSMILMIIYFFIFWHLVIKKFNILEEPAKIKTRKKTTGKGF